MSTLPRPARFPGGLYALCDDSVRPEIPLSQKARRILDGGARVLQLRVKRTPAREAIAALREILDMARSAGARCVVNDRVDFALIAGADGVHLGDTDLPVEDARRLLGLKAIIGRTARDMKGVEAAHRAGADYVGLGPIFPTATKTVDHSSLGLETLRAVASASPLPIVAISGIALQNIADVAAAGPHGAAVASDLLNAPDIADHARRLVAGFERGLARGRIATAP